MPPNQGVNSVEGFDLLVEKGRQRKPNDAPVFLDRALDTNFSPGPADAIC
jgi:hypothetical protein